MGKVVCLVGLEALLVGCLGGSVIKVNLYGVVTENKKTSCFVLQVMLGVSLCVSYT